MYLEWQDANVYFRCEVCSTLEHTMMLYDAMNHE